MKSPTIAPAYAGLYAGLCEAAREHGYCLAIHGSLTNDMDVVAIPWTDNASDSETLAYALWARVNWLGRDKQPVKGEAKPHGRMSWFFPLLQAAPGEGRSGIDLSVMPRLLPPADQG